MTVDPNQAPQLGTSSDDVLHCPRRTNVMVRVGRVEASTASADANCTALCSPVTDVTANAMSPPAVGAAPDSEPRAILVTPLVASPARPRTGPAPGAFAASKVAADQPVLVA